MQSWWVDAFGNAPLYLLDTDLPDNADAWISGQLYGWFGEERIAQEMVLGIGGVRALRALGHEVDIYHFDEGHALFAGFELLREQMEGEVGLSFKKALKQVKRQFVSPPTRLSSKAMRAIRLTASSTWEPTFASNASTL